MLFTDMKSLRNKIVLIIGSAFLLFMLFLVGISHFVILHSFEDLEEQNNRQDLLRVSNFIREDMANLESQVSDWSEWNDTYYFMAGKAPEYAESNLNINTLHNLNIDLILYLDIQGGKVDELYLPPGKEDLEPVSEDLIDTLIKEGYFVSRLATKKGNTGFLNFRNSLMMISFWPVLTTDREGPARGTMIMGKIIGEEDMLLLSEKVDHKLTLLEFPSVSQLQGSFNNVSGEEKEAILSTILRGENEQQDGFILLRNLGGEPLAIFRMPLSREIYLHGRRTVINFLLLFFFIMLIIVVIMSVFLDRSIVSRISEMKLSLGEIARKADLEGRVKESGNDEITSLSKTINHMIGTLARVLENIPDPLLLSEKDGNILLMNETGQNATGYSRNEFFSLMMGRLTGLFYARDYRTFWKDLTEQNALTFDATVVRKDGSNFPVEFHSTLFSLGERMFALSVIRDITERKQLELDLTEKAFREPLTGLPNRHIFNDRLAMAFERAGRNRDYSFALIMIDLDHFKEINDTLGHLEGDSFLSEFATRLFNITRTDDSPARWGGDEFILLVNNISQEEELVPLITRLKGITEAPVILDNKEYFPSFSVGIVIKTQAITSPAQMIAQADKALYEAKRTRENRMSIVIISK